MGNKGANSNNNKQLKQLENTVEQLRTHFVQLLQHLPLTTSQQQQLHHSNGSTQQQNANNANGGQASVPNVNGIAPLTNVLNATPQSLRSMMPSPMAPTPTITATNYATPTNVNRNQQQQAYTFPTGLSSMSLGNPYQNNPFANNNVNLLQNLTSPTNLNANPYQ